jgi:hypothetical protein
VAEAATARRRRTTASFAMDANPIRVWVDWVTDELRGMGSGVRIISYRTDA